MAYGEIGTVIDTFAFHPAPTNFIDVLHVAGDVWLFAYQSGNENTQLRTVEIKPDGQITEPVLDVYNIRPGVGQNPKLIRVRGNIYAVADKTALNLPTVTTFEVLTDGTIIKTIIDDWNWVSVSAARHTWMKASLLIQAVGYMGGSNHGFLQSIEIAPDGTITKSVIDQVKFNDVYAFVFDSTQVSGSRHVMAYRGTGNQINVMTYSVSPLGVISDPYIQNVVLTAGSSDAACIRKAYADIFAISHVREGSHAWLSTVRISPGGAITTPNLDDLNVYATPCGIPAVLSIGQGIVLYALRGPDGDGWIHSYQVDPQTGAITDTPISTYEFDPSNCDLPVLFHISGDVYAIAYQGVSAWAYLKTLTASTPPVSPHNELTAGIGP